MLLALVDLRGISQQLGHSLEALPLIHISLDKVVRILQHQDSHGVLAECHAEVGRVVRITFTVDLLKEALRFQEQIVGLIY